MMMILRRIRGEEEDEDSKTLDRFRVKLGGSEVRSLDGSRRGDMESEESMSARR
jgi:hypothetical protein